MVVKFMCARGLAPHVAREILQMHGFSMQTWENFSVWGVNQKPGVIIFLLVTLHAKIFTFMCCQEVQ